MFSDSSNKRIEKALFRLFEKEDDTETDEYTLEERYALDTFEKNVRREADGRYTVSPLFRKPNIRMRNNYYLALKRYRALRKNFRKRRIEKQNIL